MENTNIMMKYFYIISCFVFFSCVNSDLSEICRREINCENEFIPLSSDNQHIIYRYKFYNKDKVSLKSREVIHIHRNHLNIIDTYTCDNEKHNHYNVEYIYDLGKKNFRDSVLYIVNSDNKVQKSIRAEVDNYVRDNLNFKLVDCN